jgi:hypothetical protein
MFGDDIYVHDSDIQRQYLEMQQAQQQIQPAEEDDYLAELRHTSKFVQQENMVKYLDDLGLKKEGGEDVSGHLQELGLEPTQGASSTIPAGITASELKAWERVAKLESVVSQLETKLLLAQQQLSQQPQQQIQPPVAAPVLQNHKVDKAVVINGLKVETTSHLRELMRDLYRKQHPAKLAQVDSILESFKGQESSLINALQHKYPSYFGLKCVSAGKSPASNGRANGASSTFQSDGTGAGGAGTRRGSGGGSSGGSGAPAPPAGPLSPLPEWKSGRKKASQNTFAGLVGYQPDQLGQAQLSISHWELMARHLLNCLLLNPAMNDWYASTLKEVLRDVLLSLPQIQTVHYIKCSFPAVEQQAPRLVLEHWESLANGEWHFEWKPTWSIEICVEGSQFIQFKLLVRVANFELRGFLQTVFKPDLSEVRRPQTPTTNPAVDRALEPTSTSTPLAVIDYH